MNIITSLKTTLKSPAKLIGLTTLGIVGYDANHIAKIEAERYAQTKDAQSTAYYLNNTLYTTNMSKFQDGIRNLSYNMELDCGWKRFFNTGIGYIKGFFQMLIQQVVPFSLGILTLVTKGALRKASAGLICVYGAYELVRNFFGLGTPKGPLN